ncbi:AMP-binding protein [Sphingomonas sp. KR1UV-12]|uniref:AMP-binding protein n=1 Tax=Sphingomonas aurea TaxID=3063994 RepID=A0ABT9EKW6_9SPHN|nr:AMP-binding protein [Sphingomonas sp. KR1UV-12]MDP1027612.1 AMP-binding protein [Sphingomonas sp. KR1UV-12]
MTAGEGTVRPVAGDWNFGDLLDATAAAVPGDRPALIHGERVVSWADFDARTNRLARALLAAGLPTGARVAILARNIPEFIEIACAAFKARLSHVNINYRYTTGEIDYVLQDCQAQGLFYQAEFAELVAPLLPSLALAVQIDGGQYDAMVGEGDGRPLDITRSPEDGYLLYTGGTTGKPKGVMWRSGDARVSQLEAPTIKTVVRTMADHVAMVAENPLPGRVIPACPLMHGAGLNSSMAELVGGGTAVLLPDTRFDAERLWDEAERTRATRILIVGDVFARPMAQALQRHPGRWDLSSLRVISSAGLMWSREVKRVLVDAIPQLTLVDILGASEASGFGYAITTATSETPTGWFEPGRHTVLVEPETDRVLEADQPGEGWLARRAPFGLGYHGDPAKTAATYRRIGDEVLAIPGDMAVREADGRLRLVGRGNMVINTGGEKVFAEEVEEAMKRASGIEDAIVVGVPDPVWGRKVVALACVTDRYDAGVAQREMLAELAAYKMPKHIILLDTLPRHASGKSDYRTALTIAMRELGLETA